MRQCLTPEQREQRHRERMRRAFSDAAYKHYDPELEGYGSPEQWEEIATKLFGLTKLRATPSDRYLDALLIDVMPTTLAQLKSAFRAAMFKVHPDHGGTNERARAAMEAFEILKQRVT